jgi:flagellar motor switch protein FliM
VTVTPSTPRSSGETGPNGRSRRRGKSSGPTPYDFRRPMKLSREHLRTLQIAFETFGRQATTVMTSALRAVCQVNLGSVEQLTYNEYVELLSDPSRPQHTHMTLFSVEPVQHKAVLEIPISAAMACVDHMLGGPGGENQPDRPLSEIEATVFDTLIERLLTEVRYAFSSLVQMEPVVLTTEYSPQLAQAAGASDQMIVASFDLHQGEVDHVLTMALPFTDLLPYLNAHGAAGAVSERERATRAESKARLAAGFQQVPVDVAIRFRPTTADPVELAELEVGDVIRLQHPSEAPLDVTAADVVFAHASPGSQGKRLACRVVASSIKENS